MIKIKDKYQYDFVKNQLKPDMVCLDIGANIGLFTTLMADKCKEVYAFEPDKDNFKVLKDNLKDYDRMKHALWNVAVTNYTGKIKLFQCETSNGMHRVYPSKWCVSDGKKVDCISIDDVLLPFFSRVDFVKIDVEGSEWGALQGMEKTIEKFKPKMVIEFHPPSLKECDPDSPKKIYDFLIEKYKSVTLLASSFRSWSVDMPNISFNVLMDLTYHSSSRNIFVSI
jgi:FkbM family methyltransferase